MVLIVLGATADNEFYSDPGCLTLLFASGPKSFSYSKDALHDLSSVP